MSAEESQEYLELISLEVADQEYCIDVNAVREIRGWAPATALPQSPDYIRGVINLRGTIMPVLDLRSRLGLGLTEPTSRHVIVVVEAGGKLSGVLVDGVRETFKVGEDQLQSPPHWEGGEDRFVDAIIPIEQRMISRLVVTALLGEAVALAA